MKVRHRTEVVIDLEETESFDSFEEFEQDTHEWAQLQSELPGIRVETNEVEEVE